MLVFPNCKINLGLHVTARRADGFHDLETVFYPLPLCDALELVPAAEPSFHGYGIALDAPPEQNLAMRACRLVRQHYPDAGAVDLHLDKKIPFGAGLGGGSSDAAFVIRAMNDLFHLKMATAKMEALCLELGSDCPFFIRNTPQLAYGRGERMEPVAADLSGYSILLLCPGVFISTKEAFAGIVPKPPEYALAETIALPVEEWKGRMVNDFERSLAAAHPWIAQLKQQLYEAGAVYASLSGSGSSVFGIFPKQPQPQLPGYTGVSHYFE